jgi:hypothetical protein
MSNKSSIPVDTEHLQKGNTVRLKKKKHSINT